MVMAAIAATVSSLIPALLVDACKIKRIIIPNGRGACRRAAPAHIVDHSHPDRGSNHPWL
jgi:hypothetical protein